jgi:hypothetical protein
MQDRKVNVPSFGRHFMPAGGRLTIESQDAWTNRHFKALVISRPAILT